MMEIGKTSNILFRNCMSECFVRHVAIWFVFLSFPGQGMEISVWAVCI